MHHARLASIFSLAVLIALGGCADDDPGSTAAATPTSPPASTQTPPRTSTSAPTPTLPPNTATPSNTATPPNTATPTATVTATHAPQIFVFSGEGNRLNVYDGATGDKQNVVNNHNSDPNGRDINGQICFMPDGSRRFIAGEDTFQPNPPQGWGFFQLQGDALGSFSATQLGKLTPTYQSTLDNAENYGCGFLSDGRLITSDVGNQAGGAGNGQLIVWFPPFDAPSPKYCKIAIDIATAGGVAIDDQDRVYVASARGPAVYRYSPPFPTSDTAEGGCGEMDGTGAPLADVVQRDTFIAADGTNIVTPSAVVRNAAGHFFVSSVINGVIAEYDANGVFIRRVLNPSNTGLPIQSGTPFGIGVADDGTIYYADIGLRAGPGGVGPGDNTGSVRRIRFVDGAPQPPETFDTGLDFPDGIGLLVE